MAQCMNMAKGSPTLTVASKDHRGCWRGVTSKVVVRPFLADATRMFSSRGPRFLGFQVLLSQSLLTRSVSYNVLSTTRRRLLSRGRQHTGNWGLALSAQAILEEYTECLCGTAFLCRRNWMVDLHLFVN
jgi:hypothetical protein